jgi:hypothetical protein
MILKKMVAATAIAGAVAMSAADLGAGVANAASPTTVSPVQARPATSQIQPAPISGQAETTTAQVVDWHGGGHWHDWHRGWGGWPWWGWHH